MEILLKIMKAIQVLVGSVLDHKLTQKVLEVLKPVIEVLKPILSRIKYLLIEGFNGIRSMVSGLFEGDGIKSLFNTENIRQKIITGLLFLGVLFSFTRCGDDAKVHLDEAENSTVKSDKSNSKTLYAKVQQKEPEAGLVGVNTVIADAKTTDTIAREKAAKRLLAKQEEDKKQAIKDQEIEAKVEKNRLAKIETKKAAKAKAKADAKLQEEMDAKKKVWLEEKSVEVETAMGVIKDQNKMITDSKAELEDQKSQLSQKISEKDDILQKIIVATTLLSTKQTAFETDFQKSQESLQLKFTELKKDREALLSGQSSFDDQNVELDNRKIEIQKSTKELEVAEAKLADNIKVFELEKDQFNQQLADINATKIEMQKDIEELELAKSQLATDKEVFTSDRNAINAKLEKLDLEKSTFEKQKLFLEVKEANITKLIAKKDSMAEKAAKIAALAVHQAEFDKASKARESQENVSKENKKIALLSKDFNATTIELTTMKSDFDTTRNELETVKSDFATTSKELIKVKSDFNITRNELVEVKADLDSKSIELTKLNESVQSTDTQAKIDLAALNTELLKTKESLENTKVELAKASESVQSASSDKTALVAATASLAKQKSALDDSTREIQRLNQKIEALLKEQKAEEAARLEVKQQQEQKRVLLERLSLTNVQFKYNSTQLTPSSIQRLEEAAAFIIENSGYNYEIQGHTDAHGNESYNLKLSANRAEAVRSYLVSRGVETSMLRAVGFGSSKPIADNSTNEGRLKNRRVVFDIVE